VRPRRRSETYACPGYKPSTSCGSPRAKVNSPKNKTPKNDGKQDSDERTVTEAAVRMTDPERGIALDECVDAAC
jgi:hypothetical protein